MRAVGLVEHEHPQVVDGDLTEAQDVVLEAVPQCRTGAELALGHAPVTRRLGAGERALSEEALAHLLGGHHGGPRGGPSTLLGPGLDHGPAV